MATRRWRVGILPWALLSASSSQPLGIPLFKTSAAQITSTSPFGPFSKSRSRLGYSIYVNEPQIREPQRMLGKKTMDAEILNEAVEIALSRKWIAHSPLLPGDDQ
ncbi:hypothetical protein PsexTeo8_50270 [Pseudomonas extremaustralis]|nr:hypothetical protein [Pseudomonas extremaustralis]